MNTWPGGRRYAMDQGAHEEWNGKNYPGTRQLCFVCDEPTGRCEDDTLPLEDDYGKPLCESCWKKEPPRDR